MNNKKKQKDISGSLKKYRGNLSISDNDKHALVSARKEIRPCLREGLSFDHSQVKFLPQGSFRHQTINRPCHPNQQMDLDDGVYIPNSVAECKSPAQWLDHVADCLKPLAKNKRWVISTEKLSCVRVVLDKDKHIDIPLYHIPDLSIQKLQASDPSDNVQLAHREGWKNSDPRNINEWVALMSDKHGREYKHICRILKGWRDNQWEYKSPISSIMIMKMVEMAMKEGSIYNNSNKQEDEVLFEVVEIILEKVLHGDIPDPDPNNTDSLNSEWTDGQRRDCISRFYRLQKALYGAGDNDDYIKKLREEFGRFFPTDTSFIKPCKPVATLVTAATVDAVANTRPYAEFLQDDFSFWNIRRLFSWTIKNIGRVIIIRIIANFLDNNE